jgi:hypothetical protein
MPRADDHVRRLPESTSRSPLGVASEDSFTISVYSQYLLMQPMRAARSARPVAIAAQSWRVTPQSLRKLSSRPQLYAPRHVSVRHNRDPYSAHDRGCYSSSSGSFIPRVSSWIDGREHVSASGRSSMHRHAKTGGQACEVIYAGEADMYVSVLHDGYMMNESSSGRWVADHVAGRDAHRQRVCHS